MTTDDPLAAMTESRLFLSSCSRRELARRRPGRAVPWRALIVAMLVILACVAAFLLGPGGI